jgi:hypothetical protein
MSCSTAVPTCSRVRDSSVTKSGELLHFLYLSIEDRILPKQVAFLPIFREAKFTQNQKKPETGDDIARQQNNMSINKGKIPNFSIPCTTISLKMTAVPWFTNVIQLARPRIPK